MVRTVSLAALSLALASPAVAEDLRVDPDAGNNTFNAVFDAKLGERITAQSSAVACDLRYDEKTGLASGSFRGSWAPSPSLDLSGRSGRRLTRAKT